MNGRKYLYIIHASREIIPRATKKLIQFSKKEEQRMKSKIKNWGEELSRLNQRRHNK